MKTSKARKIKVVSWVVRSCASYDSTARLCYLLVECRRVARNANAGPMTSTMTSREGWRHYKDDRPFASFHIRTASLQRRTTINQPCNMAATFQLEASSQHDWHVYRPTTVTPSVLSVCLSVCLFISTLVFWTNSHLTLILLSHSWPRLKVKVIGQSRSTQTCVCVCYSCGVQWLLTDGRNIRFYCHVISCALARRGVRRGEAEANSSACGRGNVATRSVWPRSSIEDSCSS